MQRRLRFGVLVALVATTLACSRSPQTVTIPTAPPATSSPYASSQQSSEPSLTASGQPSAPTSLSPSPPTNPGELAGVSTAEIKVANDPPISLEFNQMDPYSVYVGPKGSSTLTFYNGPSSLVIGGVMDEGTRKTSQETSLNVFVAGEKPFNFVSGNGSCRITVTAANLETVEGSFRCDHAKVAKGKFVDVSGTFSGSAPA